MALWYSAGSVGCQGRSIHRNRGIGAAMIHALLWMCLLIQSNSVEPSVPPEVLTLLQTGADAENRGDFDQAIAAFRKAADVDPSAGVVFLRLGDAYMKKHDYAAAISPLKRAAELGPDSLAVHQLLGYAL